MKLDFSKIDSLGSPQKPANEFKTTDHTNTPLKQVKSPQKANQRRRTYREKQTIENNN